MINSITASRANLGFTVRVAVLESDLMAACAVRSAAYGRHLPQLARAFAKPDDLDRRPDVRVLIAWSKETGAAIGTARITTNSYEPLAIQSSIELPPAMRGASLAEITRLAIQPGIADPSLKLALFKASYISALTLQIRWLVIGARSPALIRDYSRLGFCDVSPGGMATPLAHAGGLEHRILAFDVLGAERTWYGVQHPLYEWMVGTLHTDIDLLPRPLWRTAPQWQRAELAAAA
jgi:hypothetical protein